MLANRLTLIFLTSGNNFQLFKPDIICSSLLSFPLFPSSLSGLDRNQFHCFLNGNQSGKLLGKKCRTGWLRAVTKLYFNNNKVTQFHALFCIHCTLPLVIFSDIFLYHTITHPIKLYCSLTMEKWFIKSHMDCFKNTTGA